MSDDVNEALNNNLANFGNLGKSAVFKAAMVYEEQCVREVIRALPDEYREEASALAKENGWSIQMINECFPYLPVQLVMGNDTGKRNTRVIDVFKKGNKAPIIDMYYSAREAFEICRNFTACFIRTSDAGNVVVHSIVWSGDETTRSGVPRVFVPSRDGFGNLLVIESRNTFVKLLSVISTNY